MVNNEGVPADVQSPQCLWKTNKFKLGSGEFELLHSGLEAVQSLLSSQESSYEKEVLCNLEKIGLAKPLTNIWQWQDPQVCEEFIRNWDRETKSTTVFDVPIDVSLKSFLSVTGLRADRLRSPTGNQARSCGQAWKYGKFCGAERGPWCSPEKGSPALLVSDLRNDMVRYLLVLFNETLLLGTKNPFSLSKASAYLLVEALQGNVMGWGTLVHERFMGFMGYFIYCGQRENPVVEKVLAGPLMCFLYSHAQNKSPKDFSHISRAEFERTVGSGKRKVLHRAAKDVCNRELRLELCEKLELPCRANNVIQKRADADVTGWGNLPSDVATEVPSSSVDQAQGSKASVPPTTPENTSKRPCTVDTSDIDTDPPSVRFQQLEELKAKVRGLTGKLDCKEKEISGLVVSQQKCKEEVDLKNRKICRLQQAEEDFKICYGSLESLYAQAIKNVQDLTETTKDQQEAIYQLTLREAEDIKNVRRLEKLYADEQRHATECLKLQFDAAATGGEVVKLREKVEELAGQCRESARRESFLELQLAVRRRRWDMEFPLRKEAVERR